MENIIFQATINALVLDIEKLQKENAKLLNQIQKLKEEKNAYTRIKKNKRSDTNIP
jgi:cell division protein FtsB